MGETQRVNLVNRAATPLTLFASLADPVELVVLVVIVRAAVVVVVVVRVAVHAEVA